MARSVSLSAQDFLPGWGVHEVYAGVHADIACLSGSMAMLGQASMAQQEGVARQKGVARQEGVARSVLWVRQGEFAREAGLLSPVGLSEMGISPSSFVLVASRNPLAALQAALEGARTPRLGAVILELWGEAKAYDLAASRRLSLAAKASGLRVLVARVADAVTPSAAETRWRLRALPSHGLAASAPGAPAFELSLLRARDGREGLRYHLEWDRDACRFIAQAEGQGGEVAPATPQRVAIGLPPLSGAVVPASSDRPAQGPALPFRQAG
jgi:protein ImuA